MPTPKHIVAVAGLVTDPLGRVLMIRSPRRAWEFPGGQVELGETLTRALEREVFEETGIHIKVGKLVGIYSNVKSNLVIHDFLCDYLSGEPTRSSESLDVEWVDRSEALERVTHEPIRDRLRDMLEFDGTVIYRAYSFDAREVSNEYTILEDMPV